MFPQFYNMRITVRKRVVNIFRIGRVLKKAKWRIIGFTEKFRPWCESDVYLMKIYKIFSLCRLRHCEKCKIYVSFEIYSKKEDISKYSQ